MSTPVAAPANPEGPWIFQLNVRERSTLLGTFGGWALDGMDVMVYSFVIRSLMDAWHISPYEAGLLATVPLLISSVGGWLAGLLSDRFGRSRILWITILWFAAATFLTGFTNSARQMLVTRGLQGLGFGGEWAVGSVLMGETIRARYRGKAIGMVQSGWAVGWGLAAVFFTIFFSVLPVGLNWRAMFWIGILPAGLVFYIRRHVPEPEIFEKTRHAAAADEKSHFMEIFRPGLLRVTALTSLLALGVQGGYYALTTWLPLYLEKTRGLSVLKVGGHLSVIITGAFAGYVVAGYLADLLGRKKTLVVFGIGAFLTVIAYTCMPAGNTVILLLGFPLGFFASGSFSPVGSFFTELFPNRVRGSGQGFSYNLGRGVGALFPTLVGFMERKMPPGHAIAISAMSAYLIFIFATLLLPETRGKELMAGE